MFLRSLLIIATPYHPESFNMRWLWLVGSLKSQVSFAEYSLFIGLFCKRDLCFKEPTHSSHLICKWIASCMCHLHSPAPAACEYRSLLQNIVKIQVSFAEYSLLHVSHVHSSLPAAYEYRSLLQSIVKIQVSFEEYSLLHVSRVHSSLPAAYVTASNTPSLSLSLPSSPSSSHSRSLLYTESKLHVSHVHSPLPAAHVTVTKARTTAVIKTLNINVSVTLRKREHVERLGDVRVSWSGKETQTETILHGGGGEKKRHTTGEKCKCECHIFITMWHSHLHSLLPATYITFTLSVLPHVLQLQKHAPLPSSRHSM